MLKLSSQYSEKIKGSFTFLTLLLLAVLAFSCARQPAGQAQLPGQSPPEVDWLNIQLKDVDTDKTFKLSDFKGKIVVLETMAVWCPTCKRQQIEIKEAHNQLGGDVVSISLDIDPNENEEILKKYVQNNDFDWIFAISPPLMSRQLEKLFGNAILNPPSTPVVILDRNQAAHLLKFGLKSSRELISEISRYR